MYLYMLAVDETIRREDYTRSKLVAEDLEGENLVVGIYEWIAWILDHPNCRYKAFVS